VEAVPGDHEYLAKKQDRNNKKGLTYMLLRY